MTRWAWVAVAVVLAAGAVTAWQWCELLAYNMDGLPPRPVEPELVASSLLPTGLFLAAVLLRRRSVGTRRVAAAAAVAAAGLQVVVISGELAAPWGRGTGVASFAALLAADAVAAVVFVVAAVGAVGSLVRRRPSGPDEVGRR